MEKNKYTLITIIVLLVLILPFTIYGTYKHYVTTANFKRQFKFNGKLWFYDGKKLLGTYTCKSKSCDYAIYKSGQKATIINNNYTFINDEEKVYLYNIPGKSVINEYNAVDADVANQSYFFMKLTEDGTEKWGALRITNSVDTMIEAKYDGLSYLNGRYVAMENNNYLLLEVLTPGNETLKYVSPYKIKNYNDKYIIVINQTSSCPTCTDVIIEEMIYDYEDNLYFNGRDSIDELSFVLDYILLRDNNYYYLYYLSDGNEEYIDSFTYDGSEKITFVKNSEGNIEFYAGKDLQKTIEIAHEE